MFIGHYAPALVAAAYPKAPGLGTLFAAGQLVDFAFFAFVMTGTEKMRITPDIAVMNSMDLYHMPYTHSLLGTAVWAIAFALLIYFFTRNRAGAMIGGAVVLSHWFVDVLVHVPDLTLAGSPPKLGLGLWNHPWVEIPLELGITFAALIYLARATKGSDGSNKRLWILGGFLALIQLYNWTAPEPEAVTIAMPISAIAAFAAAALLAGWAGKNRQAISA